jgi:hypothetical protein
MNTYHENDLNINDILKTIEDHELLSSKIIVHPSRLKDLGLKKIKKFKFVMKKPSKIKNSSMYQAIHRKLRYNYRKKIF